MNQAIALDTLAFVNKLKHVGVPEKQAEAHAEALQTMISEQLVTKNFFQLKMAELEHKLAALEYRLLIKLGGMMIGIVGLAVSILAVIIKN